jgi:alginate O-acetyltransferase complex protein AlgI
VVEMLLPMRWRLPPRTLFSKLVRMCLTFLMVSFAWIFFRANSFTDAIYIITHMVALPKDFITGITTPYYRVMLDDPGMNVLQLLPGFAAIPIQRLNLGWAFLLVFILVGVDFLDGSQGFLKTIERSPMVIRWGFYYGLTALILFLGVWGTQEFIYFQF